MRARARERLVGCARHLSTTRERRSRARSAIALASLFAAVLAVGTGPAAATSAAVATAIEAGDRAWSRRAEGADGLVAAPGPIAEAIAAYEAALDADPGDLEAMWKLARALYFQGEFTGMAAADRERSWERGTELAERSLAILHPGEKGWQGRDPDTVAAAVADRRLGAAIHFWAAVHWGKWGEAKGSLAAVHQGIAKRIRDHARTAIAMDETFERGGPHRLLGRLHAVAPRVPLVTGWVSRDQALRELERAVEIAPADLTNRLYLAEARLGFEPKRRARAVREIEDVIGAAPAPDNLVEDRRTQADARATLDRAGEHPVR